MFDTAEQAREYIRTFDRRVIELSRQKTRDLERIHGQAPGFVYSGPMSKDELVNAIACQEYPRIGAAREAYVNLMVG